MAAVRWMVRMFWMAVEEEINERGVERHSVFRGLRDFFS